MSYPELPHGVKSMLADERRRTHHHLWHFVRNREQWEGLPAENRSQLAAAGWESPRFEEDAGSGVDFLGMHRHMIQMVNAALENEGDSNWLNIKGWDPIPWDDNDPDWPVPEWQAEAPPWATDELWNTFTGIAEQARSAARIEEMRQIAQNLLDPTNLKSMTLDQLGSSMEWSIHGWMHIRWSGAPGNDSFSVDVENDWLFVPWSSHVNKHFWKLHGWIDERITDWEAASGQVADFSGAWSGPMEDHAMHHMADARLLSNLPPREEVPLPMQVKQPIVEGLLSK